MKILVVHDRADAAAAIERAIKDTGLVGLEITTVSDGVSARNKMQADNYDLLVIDLTIPHILSKTEVTFTVARDLLKELFTTGSLNPPGDIIGVTKEPDAIAGFSSDIGSHLMALLAETDDGSWLKALQDKVLYASRCSISRQFLAYTHHGIDCAIIVALDEECEPYKRLLELKPNKHFDGAWDFWFRDKSGGMRSGLIFPIGKSGQPRAASFAQSIISVFRPRALLMSGICGGFEDKLNFGDIGIVETVYDWDYGKWSDEKKSTEASAQGAVGEAKFLSRPAPHTISNTRAHKAARDFVASNFNLNPELKKKIQQLSLGKVQEFGVDFVHGASGSAVVAHADIVKRITGLSDAIKVVDMECYGLYQAALTTHAARPDVLCIKAVADKANHRKDDSIHAACCELSAVAVIELISNYWDFE